MVNKFAAALITGLSVIAGALFFTPYKNDGYIYSPVKCTVETTHTSQYHTYFASKTFSWDYSRLAKILNMASPMTAHGVGLIIGDGIALTARHVAEPLNRPVVRTNTGDYPGQVRGIVQKTPGIDLALVTYQAQGKSYEPLKIKNPKIGERVNIVTFDPQTSSPLEMSVIVESIGVNTPSHELMVKTRQNGFTTIKPGMSGSPGLADDGRLMTLLVEAGNMHGYFVNATEIADYLERICGRK